MLLTCYWRRQSYSDKGGEDSRKATWKRIAVHYTEFLHPTMKFLVCVGGLELHSIGTLDLWDSRAPTPTTNVTQRMIPFPVPHLFVPAPLNHRWHRARRYSWTHLAVRRCNPCPASSKLNCIWSNVATWKITQWLLNMLGFVHANSIIRVLPLPGFGVRVWWFTMSMKWSTPCLVIGL